MESLLIINSEKKAISKTISESLNQHYQISTAYSYNEASMMLGIQFFDLFLVIATKIDASLIELLGEIRSDRGDLLPVIISLPKINERSQAQAFKQRVLYLTEYPLDLEELQKELSSVSEILEVVNDKIITLSTRKYDNDYRAKRIIYFERSRPRYISVYYEEGGVIATEEIFFKASIEKFIEKHGLKRHFIQIHQSYLVNPRFIKKINKADLEVILTNGKKLPLGGTYYKKIKKGVEDDD